MFSGKLGVMKQKWGHSSSLTSTASTTPMKLHVNTHTYTRVRSLAITLPPPTSQWYDVISGGPSCFSLGSVFDVSDWGGADLRSERWKKGGEKRIEEGCRRRRTCTQRPVTASSWHCFHPLDSSGFLPSFHPTHLLSCHFILCFFELILSCISFSCLYWLYTTSCIQVCFVNILPLEFLTVKWKILNCCSFHLYPYCGLIETKEQPGYDLNRIWPASGTAHPAISAFFHHSWQSWTVTWTIWGKWVAQ